jgi:nicotinamide N-methyltransferase
MKSFSELVDTEVQHRDALVELEKMKANMEELERERALMIEEVEAQIERALASMTFSDGFSDVTGSRPGSAMSSRPPSAAGMTSSRTLRSFGTATTLAEDAREDDEEQDMPEIDDEDRTKVERSAEEPVVEVKKVEKSEEVLQQGDHALTEAKLKRFSASKRESEDGFGAVDQGISERSDLVAQKVLQIQQKV